MRIKQVLAFLGAAAVSTLALAEAAPSVAVSADGGTVVVQGNASPLVRLSAGEAADAAGSFWLEDGRVLTLTSYDRKIYMEVDGKREELLPVSKTRFVARGSGAEVALDTPRFPEKVALTQFRR
jgi:hypothetical protein